MSSFGGSGVPSRYTSPDPTLNGTASSNAPFLSSGRASLQPQGYQSANSSSQRGMARASVDASRPNLANLQTGMGSFGAHSTGSSGGRGPRPTSELLPGGMRGATSPDSEHNWYQDFEHYETTLEDMAAASLDQNFKEELTAIEQWFRVLTEPERTAALYSLLQSSTQMQIRFFISVLQQMARSDPFGAALLSPTNANSNSMESQMEARLAQLNLKTSGTNPNRYGRASLGVEPTNFLSPNAALLDPNEQAASLAAQRARLTSHRISAPGTLLSANDGLRSPIWNDSERSTRSPSPVGEGRSRPKSTGSDMSHQGQTLLRNSMIGDDGGLSPMPQGSWASMVNTPLVPMFQKSVNDDDHHSNAPQSPHESTMAASRLGWGSASTSAAPSSTSGIVLDDARKFRRTGRMPSNGGGGLGSLPPMGGVAAMGQIGSGAGSASIGGVSFDSSGNFMMPSSAAQGTGRRAVSGPASGPTRLTSPGPTQSSLLANQQQQAALAAQQNWRATNNGLLSSGGMSAGPGQTTFAQAQLGSPNPGMVNVNAMTPQELAQYNMASLLLQQQQQLQLQQNLMNLGMANNMALSPNMLGSAGGLSPNHMAMAMNNAAMLSSAVGSATARRSPRTSDRGLQNKPPPIPGSGANPDERVDDALLADVSAWLRSLRLHKYTTNFEGTRWQDMVMMDDAALDAKGVNALGARRKLLKVFEVVRSQKGIDPPPGMTNGSELTRALSPGVSSNADSALADD